MLWDNLTSAEVEFTQHVLQRLKDELWAAPLVKTIDDAGGIIQANMPFLFEARVAYALHQSSVKADYEYPTGVGSSSIDFRVGTWLIEIIKIGESAAAKAATYYKRPYIARVLKTASADATEAGVKQSPEGELLLVEKKITEKMMRGGTPIKFPRPTAGAFHMVITDTRAFLNGGDAEPIKGLLQPDNPLRGARLIQERVHFLGFVAEKSYRDNEIPRLMKYFANPHLLGDEQEAEAAWKTNPLSSGFRSPD
jgi:hypothetical protein